MSNGIIVLFGWFGLIFTLILSGAVLLFPVLLPPLLLPILFAAFLALAYCAGISFVSVKTKMQKLE